MFPSFCATGHPFLKDFIFITFSSNCAITYLINMIVGDLLSR